MAKLRPGNSTFVARHSLGLAATGILVFWVIAYWYSDPRTHLGSFFGNAIADWSGVVVMVFATKHLYEKGSAESRKPEGTLPTPLERIRDHSLTIFLLGTGVIWVAIYLRVDPGDKWGQVVGNIVSEWTQTVGLVLLTKRLIEWGSKESAG